MQSKKNKLSIVSKNLLMSAKKKHLPPLFNNHLCSSVTGGGGRGPHVCNVKYFLIAEFHKGNPRMHIRQKH